ncbi:MAG: hypothetical protein PCFJNLEI_01936 [Verrucomicrobiae bacterium]|nr:hypothetical protein [Verrucomicrobiae bacterium]
MHRQRYLAALGAVIVRQQRLFVLGGVLLAILAAGYTVWKLEFKTSRNDLIGRDSEYWRLFSEYAREFRAEEDYIILVEGAVPARNRAAVDALVKALLATENNPHPRDGKTAQQFRSTDLYYHVDYAALRPWFLYYLTPDELKQIRTGLADFKQLLGILQHDARLSTFFDAMNRMLQQMSFAGAAQRRDMEQFVPTITRIVRQLAERTPETGSMPLSPWATAFFSEEMVATAENEMRWQGYQTFQKGAMYLLLVHPRGARGETDVTHDATIDKLRRIMATVRSEFPDLKIHLTGEPVLDYDEMLVSQTHATKATVVTLVIIAVLFMFSFREILRPILAVLAMVMVLALSMGYATLAVGHLNLITVTFAVMILGLGIDLGIQFIARYEEEIARNEDRARAVSRAIEQTGPSLITAAITNAAAFFAMGLSGFRGVTELGIIAGGSMVLALVVTLLVLPALVLTIYRRQESRHIPAQAAGSWVDRVLLSRPYLVVAVCVVVTGVAGIFAWRVQFDYNVLRLQSAGLDSVETEYRLLRADAESTIFAAVVTDTLAETRRVHQQLAALPAVATVHSIAEVIPEDQEQKLALIAKIRAEVGEVKFVVPPFDPADAESAMRALAALRVQASARQREAEASGDPERVKVWPPFVAALSAARDTLRGMEPADLRQHVERYQTAFYRDLDEQLQMLRQQADRPMTQADLPSEIQRMLIGQSGKFLVRAFPKENIWERDPLVRFVKEVQSVAPKATGTPMGLYEFVEILLRGYRNAALWAMLVIAVLVLLDFRGVVATVLAILPLLVGMVWMLGAMGVFGLSFNPANILVLPLIVGIGVAYGIYVVQRYREDQSAELFRKSTGRAVVLSALTTIVAFATLIYGQHRGIQSLGLVMSIGVAACLLASLALLPALLEIARRKGWRV